MTAVLELQHSSPVADETTLEAALRACGWEQAGSASWRLATERGDCRLVELVQRDRWRQFQLTGGSTPNTDNSGVLDRNLCLFGPAKLIAQPSGQAICRVDVPEVLSSAGGHAFDADGGLQIADAASVLAAAVTTCATGKCDTGQSADNLDPAIATDLEQAGWSTSLDNGQINVHIHLPGIYRQLAIERDPHTGAKLVTNLADLAGLDDDCLSAITQLANTVNLRVPLVRLSISRSAQEHVLHAEVGFGAALIPGAFLQLALHAFETAIASCVREFEALRDPEVARLVLAAAAVRGSEFWF